MVQVNCVQEANFLTNQKSVYCIHKKKVFVKLKMGGLCKNIITRFLSLHDKLENGCIALISQCNFIYQLLQEGDRGAHERIDEKNF